MLEEKPKRKVVIIDDSELAADYAKDALEAAGYQVVTRSSAIGSSAVILRERPDVVLLDIAMPGLTGPEFVSMLRKQPKLKGTTILLYSERSTEELEAAARACGADGFVSKSTDFADIPTRVDELVRLAGGQR